jgi:hypothetical protein
MADVFSFAVGSYTVEFGPGYVIVKVTNSGARVAYAQGDQAVTLAKAWRDHVEG